MAIDLIVLTDGSPDGRLNVERIKAKYPHAKKCVTKLNDLEAYKAASKISMTSVFYLVDHNFDVDFDFSFVPSEFDQQYAHVWQYTALTGETRPGGLYMFSKKGLRKAESLEQAGVGLKYVKTAVAKQVAVHADVFVLVDGSEEQDHCYQSIKEKISRAQRFETTSAGIEAYKAVGQQAETKLFYVIDHNLHVTWDCSFFPIEFDKRFTHIWKYTDDRKEVQVGGIHLFNKEALAEATTVEDCGDGLKYFDEVVAYVPGHDIIFISYDEPNGIANWDKLRARFPHAKRVDNVHGIRNAHVAAAKLSSTQNFFVVDGDSEIAEDFDFDLPLYDEERNYVHIWRAHNPVNGLEYGYGGVKLFHKNMFVGELEFIDMSTLLGNGVKLIDEVASITRFDSSPFHAFRGAFRECAKLASGLIKNQDDAETKARLEVWTSVFNGPYRDDVKKGARLGKRYGEEGRNLKTINDFEWLYGIYRQHYPI